MQESNDKQIETLVVDLYKNKKLSLRKIAKEIGKSPDYISRVLRDKGLYVFISGNQAHELRNFEEAPGMMWVAKYKQTGETFEDFKNKAGTLTRFVLNNNLNFILPSGFKRRTEEKRTGRFWYEEFFDIIQIPKLENKNIKKCPYCDWTTFDLDNKSGAFTTHLYDKHQKMTIEYIQEFPLEISLFSTTINKLKNTEQMLSSPDNFIECKICNEKLRKITNTHMLSKHNMTLGDYRRLHGNTMSETTLNKIKDNYESCLKNYEHTFCSKAQQEIFDFICSLEFNPLINDKKFLHGIEIDILMHDMKIGIEFNGLLYHSEKFGNKNKNFHLDKTNKMNKEGYSLIHIFEDEWHYKKDIIKSKIMHILKKTPNKIHARKCIIQEISQQQKEVFLNENHILGNDFSNITYGAFLNNEIVAVMTFDNKRNMIIKNNDVDCYELKRFAIKLFTSISGIGDRILKKFINDKNPKKIISFAERTWTNFNSNNLYTNLGFVCIKNLSPDYKYFSRHEHSPKRSHKFGFGKNSLRKLFPKIYDDLLTEWEIMQLADYDRVWDCGKFKYELNL